MIIKMAIADADEEYIERLLNVLEGYEDLNLSVYTDRNALEMALASRHFDVFLFDPSVFDGQVDIGKNTLAVMLLDENVNIPESCRDYKKVKKYQRISRTYQQILGLYSEVCGDVGGVIGGGGVSAIAVYSPVGGVGKTTIALAIATRLADMGQRVFYMSLEDIASEDCYLPQSDAKGLSDVAANLGQNINFTMKIQALLQNKNQNLYYLNHFDSPNDINEMRGEEVTELIEQLEKTGLFDVLVIDTGISMNDKLLHLFESADKIVLVEKEDAIAIRKLNCFLGQSHIINEYANKMCRVINFHMGRDSVLQTNIPLIGRINAVQNPEPTQYIAALSGDPSMGFASRLIG